jgi:hypothetical protein
MRKLGFGSRLVFLEETDTLFDVVACELAVR